MDEKNMGFRNNVNNGNVTINGDFTDNSKNMIIINNYHINIQDSRINFEDSDSKIHKRTKFENDRPRLERYYKEGRKEMEFVGFVASKKTNKIVISPLLTPEGKHLSSHVIVDMIELKDYIGKIIRFRGEIYPYKVNSSDVDKYSICIDDKSVEEIQTCNHPYVTDTPWTRNSKFIDKTKELFDRTINEFVNSSENIKRNKLEEIKEYLNLLSITMTGIPNMIYYQTLTMFSMKDNLDDVDFSLYNLKHLNILLTFIAEYITGLNPDNYLDILKIITYSTLVYLGYDILHPSDKNAKRYLYETCDVFRIDEKHVDYVIKDYMKNIGGYKAIESYIPKHLRYDIFDLPKVARTLFVYRLLDS